MKHRRFNIVVICICLLYSGLAGCKTTRESLDINYGKNEENLKESLIKRKTDFKTVWIKKYNCQIKEKWKRKEFYGDIKIIKGERIRITIKSGIGIEIARVLITKDSVKIVDRMKKEVLCGGYGQMKRYFGLIDGYKKTEDLIVGNNSMVIEELERNDGNRYDIKRGENNDEIIISEKEKKGRIYKRFIVENGKKRIVEYMEKNGEMEMLKVEYINWNVVQRGISPKVLKIEVQKNGGSKSAIIKYGRVEINRQINIKFNIPHGYKVINL